MVEVSTFSYQLLHCRDVSTVEIILWRESGAFDTWRLALIKAALCAHAYPYQGGGAGTPRISMVMRAPPTNQASTSWSRDGYPREHTSCTGKGQGANRVAMVILGETAEANARQASQGHLHMEARIPYYSGLGSSEEVVQEKLFLFQTLLLHRLPDPMPASTDPSDDTL